MCIAVPMLVTAVDGNEVACERPGRNVKADASMVAADDITPGDWVLVFRSDILRKIDEDEARKIEAALTCVDAAMSGAEPDVAGAFADILEKTGQLPAHLAALVPH